MSDDQPGARLDAMTPAQLRCAKDRLHRLAHVVLASDGGIFMGSPLLRLAGVLERAALGRLQNAEHQIVAEEIALTVLGHRDDVPIECDERKPL